MTPARVRGDPVQRSSADRCPEGDAAVNESPEELYRLLVESATDYAILTLDPEGRVLTWNPGAERITGYCPEEILGQSGALLFTPEDRERGVPERELEQAAAEGRAEDERWHQRKDGSRFFASGVMVALREGGLHGFAKVMRDITDRHAAALSREARLAVARILAEAASLAEAAPQILEAISSVMEWDYAAVWSVDPNEGVLRSVTTWHAPARAFPQFEQITRETPFAPGVGLPGRVWATGQPHWVPDVVQDLNFPRRPVASAEGLHAGFAFPVLLGSRVLGVFEFFSREVHEPDEAFLRTLGELGSQVGQFIERKRAEGALEGSEARKSAILEAALDAIITIDHEDRVVEFNPAAEQTFGYSRAEVLGRPLVDLIIPPALREQHLRGMAHYLATGEGPVLGKRLEMPALRKDGSEILVELAITRIRTEGPPLFTAYLRDITEQKRAEEERAQLLAELQETNRRKDQFLAMLAHELRNPLGAVANAFHILRTSHPDQRLWHRAMGVIQRQLQHQTRLLDDLLDVSRITHGRIELRPQPTDVVQLVREAAEDCHDALEEAELALSLDVPPAPVWVMGDPTRLTQVLMNLLSNAIKFTPPGGSILVTVETEGQRDGETEGQRDGETEGRREGEWASGRVGETQPAPLSPSLPHSVSLSHAVVRVRDTGIGISPAVLPLIFETFTQADHSLDRSPGGLGLGLALVKGLVELHGGDVSAASDGLGQGAEFTVRLPAGKGKGEGGKAKGERGKAKGEAAEDSAREVDTARGSGVGAEGRGEDRSPLSPFALPLSPSRRVLVVEDNLDAAETLQDLLEMVGHQVEVAYSGPSGVEAAQRFQPDVILCDIGLPGMDGYEVAAALRQDPATAAIRLIAVTGYGEEEARRRSREAGFEQHVVKPVDPEALQRLFTPSSEPA
jgi:PAS domain S-box-containing protein